MLTQEQITKLKSTTNPVVLPNQPLNSDEAFQKAIQPKQSQEPNIIGKLGNFAKSVVSAPATMIARPFQAAAELAGASAEDVNKFNLGGLIAPVPESGKDVLKDVGRGIETVALGTGAPVLGGAAFGAGAAMEQGETNPVNIALNAALGASAGKVLSLVGQPILAASGKVIGKVTPMFIKDITSQGTKAIEEFAAAHNILPDFASKAINTAQKTLEGTETKVGTTISSKMAESTKNLKMPQMGVTEPNVPELVGQVAQGKTTDIKPFTRGLATIKTKGITSYADLNAKASEGIASMVKQQDNILAKDTTLRKLQQLALPVKTETGTISHNYVKDAIDQLTELYSKTNDVANLARINNIAAKLDPMKGTGLILKEVNQIARDYGSEIGNKAFSKITGEPLTSVNAQTFENTRSGVKETVRNLLPDEQSRTLDSMISDLYTVKDLTGKMTEKVNALTQKLQTPTVLQKIGQTLGKVVDVSTGGGIKALSRELLGIGNAVNQPLNALELQGLLEKNLSIIESALKQKTDAGFLKEITPLLNKAKSKKKLSA